MVWQISGKVLAYNSWGPGFHPQHYTHSQSTRKVVFSYTVQILRTTVRIMLEKKNFCSTDIKKDLYSQLTVNLGSFFKYMITLENMTFKSFGWLDRIEY